MLKSRRVFPPGGWQFFQPQTGWPKSQVEFMGLDFDQTVAKIVQHRLANPRFSGKWSTNTSEVADELDEYTCVRIARNPNYCVGGSPPSFRAGAVMRHQSLPPKQHEVKPRQIVQRVSQSVKDAGVAVVTKITEVVQEGTKVVAGIGLFKDWVGDGMKPVEKDLAEKRALVCADCPQNKQSSLTSFFTVKASEMILKQIAIKEDMALETSKDSALGICQACACPMRLKVWTPLEHIKNHLINDAKASLDARCWIMKE